MLRRIYIIVPILVALLYVLVFRHMYYEPESRSRSDAGKMPWLQRGFTVAVVWPPHDDIGFVEGVQLAADEVNASANPMAGKFKIRRYTEYADKGAIAFNIARDDSVVAVLGHEIDEDVIPASLVYNTNGILYLAPKSTDVRLTRHQFQFVFRMTPDDEDITRNIAHFAKEQNWPKVGVVHGRADHGVLVTDQFRTAALRDSITLPWVQSYFHEPRWQNQDFRPMIAEMMRNKPVDALLIADQMPWPAKLLRDLAVMGFKVPIIGTDELDTPDLPIMAGAAANGVYVASAVDPESPEVNFQAFRQRFYARYKVYPGYGASQGYESMMLYANAVAASGDADPIVVSTTIRTRKWDGLFGEFSFTPNGDVVGRDISIKQLINGVFKLVRLFREDA